MNIDNAFSPFETPRTAFPEAEKVMDDSDRLPRKYLSLVEDEARLWGREMIRSGVGLSGFLHMIGQDHHTPNLEQVKQFLKNQVRFSRLSEVQGAEDLTNEQKAFCISLFEELVIQYFKSNQS